MTKNSISHALVKILMITIVFITSAAIAKFDEAIIIPHQLQPAIIHPQILWLRRRWKPTYEDVIDDMNVCIKKCDQTYKNDQSLLLRCIAKCSALKICTDKCEEQFSGDKKSLQKCYKRCNKSSPATVSKLL
ncbi:hypothetical protein PIB30_085925 [Stylosanthes scabra]|uniref:Uncharacterized protein n=1 Tax=Stylosanthes scabra TaxID=79078 RepID=A0ABU6WWI0_9FABA|nr:hypothetical protein [Stylosanthes scabra]